MSTTAKQRQLVFQRYARKYIRSRISTSTSTLSRFLLKYSPPKNLQLDEDLYNRITTYNSLEYSIPACELRLRTITLFPELFRLSFHSILLPNFTKSSFQRMKNARSRFRKIKAASSFPSGRKSSTLTLFPALLLMTMSFLGEGAHGNCQWNLNSKSLICANFRISNNTASPGERFMDFILWNLESAVISQVNGIYINESFIPALDLNQFHGFPSLRHLSIHNSNVCSVSGTLPAWVISLNLSNNVLMSMDIDADAFEGSQLKVLDFSYNKLDQLPNNTLANLVNLKKLLLIGNEIKCSWVTGTKFYQWASKNDGIIQDIDETFCLPAQDAVFGNMTFLAALKVRKTGLEECNKAKCECDIWTTHVVEKGEDSVFKSFPVVHSNKYGRVYLTLKLDCSNMGLDELPSISPYTTVLVVDNNRIRDLSRLNTDNDYAHLTHISLNQNLIDDLDSITNTKFFDRVQFFGVKKNSMTRITEKTINSIFSRSDSTRRINNISLGDNTIYCDCNSFIKLKSTLIVHESIIKDWKTIRCKLPNVTLHELKYAEACQIEGAEAEEWPWWIVIAIECFLILAVLLKLWNDRRHYIRTGQLPSLSSCMPSLPCDFMLEKIDDSKKGHHHTHHKR